MIHLGGFVCQFHVSGSLKSERSFSWPLERMVSQLNPTYNLTSFLFQVCFNSVMRNLVDSPLIFFKVKVPFLVYHIIMLTAWPAHFALLIFVKLIVQGSTAKELETGNLLRIFYHYAKFYVNYTAMLLQLVHPPNNSLNKLNSRDVLDDSPRWRTGAILREPSIPSLRLVFVCSKKTPWGWTLGAETCSILLLMMSCILSGELFG